MSEAANSYRVSAPDPRGRHSNGRQVLVTGGAGFIGSHLVDSLVDGGASVRVIDSFATGREANLARSRERIELVVGDIRDLELCRRVCRGVDTVFHLAALGSVPRSLEDPATSVSVNVAGTANVFTGARDAGVKRVVFASSSSVYGDSASARKREGDEGSPLSPYALSKAATERLAALFSRCYGMSIVGLRFFNVYGPRQDADSPYAAVVPRFVRACVEGVAPVIYGDGLQSRDFTYVADAVQGCLAAAGAPAPESAPGYNIAGGEPVSVNEILRLIRERVGRGTDPVHVAERPGDVRHSAADLTRSAEHLGYAPRVRLAQGLSVTVEWFLAALDDRNRQAATSRSRD